MSKKNVLSCIQPTGEMHLGNYFGAVQNWVRIQDKERYNCIYGIVDLHAMTMPYESNDLRNRTMNMAAELLACGITPDKSTLFIQSLVPEHTELNWILNCVTSYGELSRMTQFKDKKKHLESVDKDFFVSAGLFTYPVLQAADILIYKADLVPVGKDQEQHLELSRNIAVRFNNQFEPYFPEPQALFTDIPKLKSLADPTKKMSKSLGEKHYIGLFESADSIRKKVRSAVTDSGNNTKNDVSDGVENLFTLLKSCGKLETAEQLMNEYASGNLKYSVLKDVTADALVELTARMSARKNEILKDKTELIKSIGMMSERARELASNTLADVKRIVGLH